MEKPVENWPIHRAPPIPNWDASWRSADARTFPEAGLIAKTHAAPRNL